MECQKGFPQHISPSQQYKWSHLRMHATKRVCVRLCRRSQHNVCSSIKSPLSKINCNCLISMKHEETFGFGLLPLPRLFCLMKIENCESDGVCVCVRVSVARGRCRCYCTHCENIVLKSKLMWYFMWDVLQSAIFIASIIRWALSHVAMYVYPLIRIINENERCSWKSFSSMRIDWIIPNANTLQSLQSVALSLSLASTCEQTNEQ